MTAAKPEPINTRLVGFQLHPNSAPQSISVYAQSLGCSALISFVVAQHREDERALELAQGFLELHSAAVHHCHNSLKFCLHNDLFLIPHLCGNFAQTPRPRCSKRGFPITTI